MAAVLRATLARSSRERCAGCFPPRQGGKLYVPCVVIGQRKVFHRYRMDSNLTSCRWVNIAFTSSESKEGLAERAFLPLSDPPSRVLISKGPIHSQFIGRCINLVSLYGGEVIRNSENFGKPQETSRSVLKRWCDDSDSKASCKASETDYSLTHYTSQGNYPLTLTLYDVHEVFTLYGEQMLTRIWPITRVKQRKIRVGSTTPRCRRTRVP